MKPNAGSVRLRPLGFQPPLLVLNAELEWVLMRAFGPVKWAPSAALASERVLKMALRLDVAGRVAARQPRQVLAVELGQQVAEQLREEYLHTVARDVVLGRALDLLLERAAAANVPCVLLKYAALARMDGVLTKGARSATDLDVLVPRALAEQFHAGLKLEGYTDVGLPAAAHQLCGLRDPHGVLIEVHVHVPGVALSAAAPYVGAEELIGAGLTRRTGNALLPAPEVVAAHAIAHGLVQHARAPHIYSPLKTFADLIDLQQAGYGGAFEGSEAYLRGLMTVDDLRDSLVLARALGRGDLHTALQGGSGVLLRHTLASQLDPRYAAKLRLRGLTRPGPTPLRLSALTPGRLVREAWQFARTWIRD